MHHNGIQLGDGGLSKPFDLSYMVPPAGSKVMCVPSMGIWYRRYQIIPEGEMPVPTNDGIPCVRG